MKSEEEGGYLINLKWEEQDDTCTLMYSLKINSDTDHETNYNTTKTMFTILHISRGSILNITIAGINGKLIGPYSDPPLCVYIQGKQNCIPNLMQQLYNLYLLYMHISCAACIYCSARTSVKYNTKAISALPSDIVDGMFYLLFFYT